MHRCYVVALAAIVLFVSGCGKNLDTPFVGNPKLSPLAKAPRPKGQGPYCSPDPTGKYDLNTVIIAKKGNNGQHDFAQGGGCVGRSLAEVLAVTHNQEFVHWSKANLKGFQIVSDPRVDFLMKANYAAGPFPFTQKWLMEWYESVTEGTIAAPKHIVINYKKVQGTSYISFWQGSLDLIEVADNVTSFAMEDQVTAAQTGPEESAASVAELLAHARTLTPAAFDQELAQQ
jgi:hypothetical protein